MEQLLQPALPPRLARLNELAYDLWWTWNPLARDVFKTLDHSLWRQTAHNPVLMLFLMPPDLLQRAAEDDGWLELFDRAIDAMDAFRNKTDTLWASRMGEGATRAIAYFSAEFALHQSLPIYAGGLGVLAGDHCKEASDLGLPLVGVGFMYPQGYFKQRVSPEGWQQEEYVRLDWTNAPVEPALTPAGHPCIVAVPLGSRSVLAQVWRIRMGRVTLLLLDTDLEENAPWDRELSARLYGGDRETRIQQEVILGIGGVRVLRAMGYDPAAWHLNEGHAAFVVLQRIREHIEQGLSFDDALQEVRKTTVFTTHTPVPAGHDAFPFQLVEQHLAGCWGDLGEHRDAFLELGLYDNGTGPLFNMTALALRSAGFTNAVSKLHRDVTADMWAPIWPQTPPHQRPVTAITNGVHVPTWVSPVMAALFDRYLGADWRDRTDDEAFWLKVADIPGDELWAARQQLRGDLFTFIRERARLRWAGENATPQRVLSAGTLFDPAALTIGFARRFTAYKRPELIFRDAERLAKILNQTRRPVQLVFAGKAHPADDMGKHHLHHIYQRAIDPVFGGRVAFVDDYDLHVAHYLVSGVDVWLNNPRKPLEASGTSGMKAAINGVPHMSIGDGWWAEGFDQTNGWLIEGVSGQDTIEAAERSQDAVDAADAGAIYTLLEDHIVPAFYHRDRTGLPDKWLEIVRNSIRTVTPRFSARRMLIDYVEKAYAPAYAAAPGRNAQS